MADDLVRRWEEEDRKRGPAFLRARREKNAAFWRDAAGSLEAVYARLNDPRRFPTPQTTIEAILYCVRERGLAALDEPANVARLAQCDEAAHKQINERVKRLQNESHGDG